MGNKKGEISTLVIVGIMTVIGVATFVTSTLTNQRQTTQTRAGSGECRNSPVPAGDGLYWEADCSKACTSNADCPQNPNDFTPSESNWCYGFETPGWRCMMRKSLSGSGNSQPTQPPGGGSCDPDWSCLGECADANVRAIFGDSRQWKLEKECNSGQPGACTGENPATHPVCPQGGSQTQPTQPPQGGNTANGCYRIEGNVDYIGNRQFNVTIRFVSQGGDGDSYLHKDGQLVGGPNAWNRGIHGDVWTWVPDRTGSPISLPEGVNSLTVNYQGHVGNACPNPDTSISCHFAMNGNQGVGNCGGAPPQPQPTSPPTGGTQPPPQSCGDNPVSPPLGYKWQANCSQTCENTQQCPQNTSDLLNVNPATSNWCYEFAPGNATSRRCLMLIKEGGTGGVNPTVIPTPLPSPTLRQPTNPPSNPTQQPAPQATSAPSSQVCSNLNIHIHNKMRSLTGVNIKIYRGIRGGIDYNNPPRDTFDEGLTDHSGSFVSNKVYTKGDYTAFLSKPGYPFLTQYFEGLSMPYCGGSFEMPALPPQPTPTGIRPNIPESIVMPEDTTYLKCPTNLYDLPSGATDCVNY